MLSAISIGMRHLRHSSAQQRSVTSAGRSRTGLHARRASRPGAGATLCRRRSRAVGHLPGPAVAGHGWLHGRAPGHTQAANCGRRSAPVVHLLRQHTVGKGGRHAGEGPQREPPHGAPISVGQHLQACARTQAPVVGGQGRAHQGSVAGGSGGEACSGSIRGMRGHQVALHGARVTRRQTTTRAATHPQQDGRPCERTAAVELRQAGVQRRQSGCGACILSGRAAQWEATAGSLLRNRLGVLSSGAAIRPVLLHRRWRRRCRRRWLEPLGRPTSPGSAMLACSRGVGSAKRSQPRARLPLCPRACLCSLALR